MSPRQCAATYGAGRGTGVGEGDHDDHDVVHWLTPVTDEEYAATPTV